MESDGFLDFAATTHCTVAAHSDPALKSGSFPVVVLDNFPSSCSCLRCYHPLNSSRRGLSVAGVFPPGQEPEEGGTVEG